MTSPSIINGEDFSGITFRFQVIKEPNKLERVVLSFPAELVLQSLFLREILDELAMKREDFEEEEPDSIIPIPGEITSDVLVKAFEYCRAHQEEEFKLSRKKKYRELTEDDLALFSSLDDKGLQNLIYYAEYMEIPTLYNSAMTFAINHLRDKPRKVLADIVGIKDFDHHRWKEALLKLQFLYYNT